MSNDVFALHSISNIVNLIEFLLVKRIKHKPQLNYFIEFISVSDKVHLLF